MSHDTKHPELHVYEENRDDLMDVATGFGVFFVILLVIAIVATAISMSLK